MNLTEILDSCQLKILNRINGADVVLINYVDLAKRTAFSVIFKKR